MKRTWPCLFVLCAALTAAERRLVWSDEFDGSGLPDPSKWTYEEGFIRNQELQFYTRARPENARLESGLLLIEGRKERFRNADYTSASVTTEGKAAWRHARVEVRAKLPAGRGTWPAIWRLGANHRTAGWPKCGEIDVMENVGFEPDMIHANIHTEAYNHVRKTGKGSKIEIAKPFDSFHVYAVDWTGEQMDFLVDGKKYFSYVNEKSGEAAWPYDQPFYLILNLALGGAWGGQKGVDDSIFPQRMEIDWVRVYQ